MSDAFKDHWNEFQWEKELRKDDARVAAYMQELPLYIDLPSEDEVIMKHIQEKPGLVPADGNLAGTFLDNMFNDEEEAEIDLSDDWQKRDGADFYVAASRLARMWALYFAKDISAEVTLFGMRILCLYGELMARSGDLIDMEDEEYLALRIAICKRLLRIVNDLMGEFRTLQNHYPNATEKADFYFDQLLIFRDKLLTLLKKYRSAGKK